VIASFKLFKERGRSVATKETHQFELMPCLNISRKIGTGAPILKGFHGDKGREGDKSF